MPDDSRKIGCPECDLLISRPALTPGQRAICPRCGYVLSVCYADSTVRALSFAIAALVLFTIAVSFPFLKINSSGIESSTTLMQTVSYVAEYGATTVAVLIFLIIILIPAIMLGVTVLLASMLLAERFPNWMLPVTRWLFHFDRWAMVEVFSIAVIVSVVKIISMAHVEFGWSFWAYLGFTVLFLMALSSLDRLTVWQTVSRLRHAS